MFILMTHYKRTYHTVPRLGQPNPQGQVHCHRSYYCCWSRSQNRCRSCCYCSCCYYHSRYCCCCWHYCQQGSVAHHVTATHQELMGHRGMVAPQVCVAHPVAGGTPERGTGPWSAPPPQAAPLESRVRHTRWRPGYRTTPPLHAYRTPPLRR